MIGSSSKDGLLITTGSSSTRRATSLEVHGPDDTWGMICVVGVSYLSCSCFILYLGCVVGAAGVDREGPVSVMPVNLRTWW
jgi:hypothetical protein